MNRYDCIIIGRGPAGLSAALYCARAGLSTMVLARDDGALAKAAHVENYFAADGAPSGSELLSRARAQAARLKVEFAQDEVLAVEPDNGFTVVCTRNSYSATAVIIATGAQRRSALLKNAAAFEGKGLSYCAVCDAFFYRGKTVAVLGAGEYALHELSALLPLAAKCYLLTDGAPAPELPDGVECITLPVKALKGDVLLSSIEFSDSSSIAADGLFVALGVAGAGDLARKIGAETQGGSIVVDKSCRCTVDGLFAAGDCTGGILQASVAVGEGATAAMSAIAYVKKMRSAQNS